MEIKLQQLVLNPKLGIRYNFSPLHYILFSFSNKNTSLNIYEVSDLYQIEDGQTLKVGRLTPEELPFHQTYSITYVNFNFIKRTLLSGAFSYSNASNIISSQIFSEENYLTVQSIIQPYQRNINGNILFQKPLWNKKLRWSSKVTYQNIHSTILQRETPTDWQLKTTSFHSSINSQSKSVWNYNFGLIINLQEQFFGKEETTIAFTTIQPNTSLAFSKNTWTIKNKLSYFNSLNNNGLANQILNWNIEVKYNPTNIPFNISLIGNNLLNIKGRSQLDTTFNPIFIEVGTYQTFSGFLLMQLRYEF